MVLLDELRLSSSTVMLAHALLAQHPIGLFVVDAVLLHEREHRLDDEAAGALAPSMAREPRLQSRLPAWPLMAKNSGAEDALRPDRLDQDGGGPISKARCRRLGVSWPIRRRAAARRRRQAAERGEVGVDEDDVGAP